MTGRQGPRHVQTKLQRVATLAQQAPTMAMTTLAHHIDIHFLYEAMLRVRKDGAVGIDGVTAEEYQANAERNLKDLHERFKSRSYKAPPVRRVHIPKGDGTKTRPIGIPTYEDKILQRAVEMILSAVYEQDFLDCSYGFRKGRNQHQALDALWSGIMGLQGGWLLEVDIQGFFDNIDYVHLRTFLERRIRDGVIRRTIDKWLRAGVMEDGAVKIPETGSPQGGVISPVLANIYLHNVVDEWFEDQAKPRLKGEAKMIRFADDFIMVFTEKSDAERVHNALGKRMSKYGLTLHPEKTKITRFQRPPSRYRKPSVRERPGTFNFLGFTHYWGKSQKGNWVVKTKTARDRQKRTLKRMGAWLEKNRHKPVKEQHKYLKASVLGHYTYYGRTSNFMLHHLAHEIKAIWREWLNRRSQGRRMSWVKFHKLLKVYPIPAPRFPRSIFKRM